MKTIITSWLPHIVKVKKDFYFKIQIIQRRKFNNVTLVSYFLNYFIDTKATLDN